MKTAAELLWTIRRLARGRQAVAADRWSMANVKVVAYELARLRAKCVAPFQTLAPPPDTAALGSLVCMSQDWQSQWLPYWASRLGMKPALHRKLWEFAYVAQVLSEAGMLRRGKRGLGFGCGKEPLPSLFVAEGCDILATDLETADPRATAWSSDQQHARSLASVWVPGLCTNEQAQERLRFMAVDMNDVPAQLHGEFDFCWSSCALEHLGSIEQGLAFIVSAARCLKPGGVAVHTTELNPDAGPTLDHQATVLFQIRHFNDLSARLGQRGIDMNPVLERQGDPFLDGYVDLPPYPEPSAVGSTLDVLHLRLLIGAYRSTSVGLRMRA